MLLLALFEERWELEGGQDVGAEQRRGRDEGRETQAKDQLWHHPGYKTALYTDSRDELAATEVEPRKAV